MRIRKIKTLAKIWWETIRIVNVSHNTYKLNTERPYLSKKDQQDYITLPFPLNYPQVVCPLSHPTINMKENMILKEPFNDVFSQATGLLSQEETKIHLKLNFTIKKKKKEKLKTASKFKICFQMPRYRKLQGYILKRNKILIENY